MLGVGEGDVTRRKRINFVGGGGGGVINFVGGGGGGGMKGKQEKRKRSIALGRGGERNNSLQGKGVM